MEQEIELQFLAWSLFTQGWECQGTAPSPCKGDCPGRQRCGCHFSSLTHLVLQPVFPEKWWHLQPGPPCILLVNSPRTGYLVLITARIPCWWCVCPFTTNCLNAAGQYWWTLIWNVSSSSHHWCWVCVNSLCLSICTEKNILLPHLWLHKWLIFYGTLFLGGQRSSINILLFIN